MRLFPTMRAMLVAGAAAAIAALGLLGCRAIPASRPATAEGGAVAYLAREVPLWFQENQCYSCHNNGDAARALFAASTQGYAVPSSSLRDTLAWLAKPEGWDHNKGEPGFSDKRLARLQFALALDAAMESGLARASGARRRAAALVAEEQDADGAWHIGSDSALGSPATYGAHLATALALGALRRAGPAAAPQDPLAQALRRADTWIRSAPVRNVLEASAVLLGLRGQSDAEAEEIRARCVDLLRRGRGSDGGWGPYALTAPEPFDTAVALLALQTLDASWKAGDLIASGRSYLVRTQMEDGSWMETTRPPRGESYAQRVSTTGWVVLALLATSAKSFDSKVH